MKAMVPFPFLKALIFLTIVVSFSSVSAQEKQKNETVQTVKMGTRKSTPTLEQQKANIKSHLKSIKVKEEYIKSNDSLTQKAKDSGWFKQMEAIRESLLLELEELENNSSN